MAFVAANAAQNTPVFQSGLVTHGHLSYWITNGVVGDAGTAGDGNITELGITNSGLPLCINDQLTTSSNGYHRLCLGAQALGSGLLDYSAQHSAAALPLTVNVDGPLVIASQTGDVHVPGLPVANSSTLQLCISPTTGALSIAADGIRCGGGVAPPQFVLLQGGGYLLLQGGAGKVQLQ